MRFERGARQEPSPRLDPKTTHETDMKEEAMRLKLATAVLALATVVTAAMTTMTPRAANAAPYWPWCSRYFVDRGGPPLSCAFASWEQCMDTVRGIGGLCYMNPYPRPYVPAAGRPVKSRRHAVN
jgi:hypothetical protein